MSRSTIVRAAAGLVICAALVAITQPADLSETAIAVSILALIFMPAVAARHTLDVKSTYELDERRPRSWVLRLLLTLCYIALTVAVVISVVAVAALARVRLPRESLLVLTVSLIVLEAVPSIIRNEIRRRGVRRATLNEVDRQRKD